MYCSASQYLLYVPVCLGIVLKHVCGVCLGFWDVCTPPVSRFFCLHQMRVSRYMGFCLDRLLSLFALSLLAAVLHLIQLWLAETAAGVVQCVILAASYYPPCTRFGLWWTCWDERCLFAAETRWRQKLTCLTSEKGHLLPSTPHFLCSLSSTHTHTPNTCTHARTPAHMHACTHSATNAISFYRSVYCSHMHFSIHTVY